MNNDSIGGGIILGKAIDKNIEVLYCAPDYCDLSEKELEQMVEEAGQFDAEKASGILESDLTALISYAASAACYTRLSQAEEVALALSVRRGMAAQHRLDAFPDIQEDEKNELSEIINIGEKAKNKLITSNLKLVVYAAYKAPWYCGKDIMDIIQDGNVGLIRAVELYEPEKGYRFSTYAMRWIQDAIYTAGRNMRFQCKMSQRSFAKLCSVIHAARKLECSGERIDAEKVSKIVGIKERDTQRLLTLAMYGNAIRRFDEATMVCPKEEKTGDDETADIVINAMCHHQVKKEVDKFLTPRQSEVIDMLYGLSGNSPMSLSEIGEKLGISRQSIFTTRGHAMERLQHPAAKHALSSFLS